MSFKQIVVALGCVTLLAALPVQVADARQSLRERLKARMERTPQQDRQTGPERITAPGDYQYSFQHGGKRREYLLHVPKSYRPGQPTALVLALHGGGGGPTYQADDKNYGLISASEKAGYLVAFPGGISPVKSGMLATWNAGRCCGSARDKQVDDVGFLRAVVQRISAQANVDRAHVHAIGMSNGGLMAYRLACDASDMFRSIMAVAGTDNTVQCQPAKPVAVLHIHARDDDHVLYDGGAGPGMRDPSKVTEFTSVPVTMTRWVAHNSCSATPRQVLRVPGAICEQYDGCASGGTVQLCVTDTGGHSWPGGGAVRGKQPSTAINANDVMWDFFSRVPPR